MDDKIYADLVIDLVIPPVMTALWIVIVRVNNKYSLRQIAPQPWLTLIKFYVIVILLTVIHLCAR